MRWEALNDLSWRIERRWSGGIFAGRGLRWLPSGLFAGRMAQRAQRPWSQAPPEGIRHKGQPDIEGIETCERSCVVRSCRHKGQPDIEGIETRCTWRNPVRATSQRSARHRGHRKPPFTPLPTTTTRRRQHGRQNHGNSAGSAASRIRQLAWRANCRLLAGEPTLACGQGHAFSADAAVADTRRDGPLMVPTAPGTAHRVRTEPKKAPTKPPLTCEDAQPPLQAASRAPHC